MIEFMKITRLALVIVVWAFLSVVSQAAPQFHKKTIFVKRVEASGEAHDSENKSLFKTPELLLSAKMLEKVSRLSGVSQKNLKAAINYSVNPNMHGIGISLRAREEDEVRLISYALVSALSAEKSPSYEFIQKTAEGIERKLKVKDPISLRVATFLDRPYSRIKEGEMFSELEKVFADLENISRESGRHSVGFKLAVDILKSFDFSQEELESAWSLAAYLASNREQDMLVIRGVNSFKGEWVQTINDFYLESATSTKR